MRDEPKAEDRSGVVDLCRAVMNWVTGEKCGLPLHPAPEGADIEPVCLMHSKDPAKGEGELSEKFWNRVEAILTDAGEDQANFRWYVFPGLNFPGRELIAACDFSYATFLQGVDFIAATFARNAEFHHVTFMQGAKFGYATFTQDATFSFATFLQGADFMGATFTQTADFNNATFTQASYFNGGTFTQNADFSGAKFNQAADIGGAIFLQDADFGAAIFAQNLDFNGTTFTQVASYSGTNFEGSVDWGGSRFLGRVEFRRAKFQPTKASLPSAFSLASFSKPEEVVFDSADLSHVSFHNCDVSKIWFTSSVRWSKRDRRNAVLVEETMTPEAAEKLGLWVNGHLDYKAIAQIYQQLKKNYDDRLDYWTANEFHFGEMEMQRLDGPWDGPLLGMRQWWHRRLSLVALYRWGSSYGNSFQRPLLWLGAVLLLAAVLYPVAGLAHTVGQGAAARVWVETFGSAWRAGGSGWEKVGYVLGVLGHGMLTAVDTASFQRNLEYAPVYPWGRVLAIGETLLTSTLVALFFLALRRQFRR